MRGIDTQVRKTRRAIFREVANMAYHSANLVGDMEALPYKLVDAENSPYWDNIYREREIIRERTRLAMGMSLRTDYRPVARTPKAGPLQPVTESYFPMWRRV